MRTLVLAAVAFACAPSDAAAPAAPPLAASPAPVISIPCEVTAPPPVPLTPPPTAGTGPNPSLVFAAGADSFLYGNSALIVVLPRDGTLHPDPASPDGEIDVKFAWWRSVPGDLVVATDRLDARSPSLPAFVPSGYGDRGFQVSRLRFSGPGCWRVTGTSAGEALNFVVMVASR